MKHAGPKSLEVLSDLLNEIRKLPGPVERKTGIFYLRGKALLHFHEDPEGLFADLRMNGLEFTRFPVNSNAEKTYLLESLREVVQP
jgi:hypothetical protein